MVWGKFLIFVAEIKEGKGLVMKVLLIILFVVLSLVFLFLVFVVIAAFYSGYQVKKSGGEAWWERDEGPRKRKISRFFRDISDDEGYEIYI